MRDRLHTSTVYWPRALSLGESKHAPHPVTLPWILSQYWLHDSKLKLLTQVLANIDLPRVDVLDCIVVRLLYIIRVPKTRVLSRLIPPG